MPSGGSAFEFDDVMIEDPRDDEIRVKIKGVGLCHTDLVFSSGMAPYPFPAVFGHEGAGIVEAVGKDVTKVQPGDAVLMTFRSCGTCDRCDDGHPPYCRSMLDLNYNGRREDGTSALKNDDGDVSSNFFGQSSFATHAITYERNVVKVDADLPVEIMGPLGCGVQTGVGSVLRAFKAEPGSSLMVLGGGSVGLSAVMGGKIAGCDPIIVVEPVAARRELAIELGATHAIDPTGVDDLAAAVREILPLGVSYALDTSGVPAVQAAAVQGLGSMGVLGLVGVSPPDITLPGEVNSVMTFGQTIRGIIEGDSEPDVFIPELVDYYKAGKLPFDKMVKTFKLSDINQAIHAQHSGECVKVVLIPD